MFISSSTTSRKTYHSSEVSVTEFGETERLPQWINVILYVVS
nr:MAG TPA: hypothetical protein [Bacteriophage sp.]